MIDVLKWVLLGLYRGYYIVTGGHRRGAMRRAESRRVQEAYRRNGDVDALRDHAFAIDFRRGWLRAFLGLP